MPFRRSSSSAAVTAIAIKFALLDSPISFSDMPPNLASVHPEHPIPTPPTFPEPRALSDYSLGRSRRTTEGPEVLTCEVAEVVAPSVASRYAIYSTSLTTVSNTLEF